MKRPEIKETQFAVLMVEGATGIVLTAAGKKYLGDDQDVYVIFDDLQSANQCLVTMQNENETVEFSVFDSKHALVAFNPAIKWKD